MFLLFAATPVFAGEGTEGGHSVISNIAVCMVTAGLLGLIMKTLRQPLIMGYILAGVIIGPIGFRYITGPSEIITIAEIGLILLLFMIGLEIDLKKMFSAGKLVILTGILQFPICLGLGFLIFSGLGQMGLDLGDGYNRFYLAIAVSISSTMIVVKLLYDKMELDTLPGRITIGILIFQDIWAIIILTIQPNLSNPQVMGILKTFGIGGLLVAAALVISKYVLPVIFKSAAKLPELMMVLALAWCFLICLVAAHPKVGLSMEMGALIAGVALATFPYNLDVIAKVTSIRDFFITLFFVALGMQIPIPHVGILGLALLIAGVVILLRIFGVFAVLYTLRGGHRTSLLASFNLSQISEFSLVILTLGIGFGHIGQASLTTVIWVFVILAVGSTYLVKYSHGIQGFLSRRLSRLGIKDLSAPEKEKEAQKQRPIIMLGFFRIGSAFLDHISRKKQNLLDQIMVVDFNPVVKQELKKQGIPCVYGDVSHPDTLHHAKISHARVVLCTIPDAFLKGTSNHKFIGVVRRLCPEAKIIVTGENDLQSRALYDAGADLVIQTSALAANFLIPVVEQALADNLNAIRTEALQELETHNEFLK